MTGKFRTSDNFHKVSSSTVVQNNASVPTKAFKRASAGPQRKGSKGQAVPIPAREPKKATLTYIELRGQQAHVQQHHPQKQKRHVPLAHYKNSTQVVNKDLRNAGILSRESLTPADDVVAGPPENDSR